MNAQSDSATPIIGPDGKPWQPADESSGWTPRRQQRTHDQVKSAIADARAAAGTLRASETATKDRALLAVADALLDRGPEIRAANDRDVSAAGGERVAERLALSPTDLSALADDLRSWAALPNPVGEILRKTRRSDGAQRHQVRVPIGVVAVLYEEQATDGFRALGPLLKTGNAVLLRGSRSATLTGAALVGVAREALTAVGIPPSALQLISSTHRVSMRVVITARGEVDLIIPFLGPGMLAGVVPDATVPLLDLAAGRCHLYVDATADLRLAEDAILASTVGPTATVGTVLVHSEVAAEFLPRLAGRLRRAGIGSFGDARCVALVPQHRWTGADGDADRAGEALAIAVVESQQEALGHIVRHSSGHTDVVISRDDAVIAAFTGRVDSATVVVNAPTTPDAPGEAPDPVLAYAAGRLAPRGPLGLTEFTTTQWIVFGDPGGRTRTDVTAGSPHMITSVNRNARFVGNLASLASHAVAELAVVRAGSDRRSPDAGSVPTTTYHPYLPAVLDNPYGFYRDLLVSAPVHYNPEQGIWILSRYEHVRAALRADAVFCSRHGLGRQRVTVPMMISTDRPEHTRLRRLVSAEFSRAALNSWRPLINELCDELVETAVERGRMDALAELAIPLPVGVIARMLGVPAEDRDRFQRWSHRSMRALELNTAIRSVGPFAGSMIATVRLHDYLQRQIAHRRERPSDDIISRLVTGGDEPLTSDELFWFSYLLLVAGNETTTNLISTILLTLARQPGLYADLRRAPELIPAAVEEQLRLYSPVQGFYRTALTDHEVEGHVIPEGARVLLLFAAANRDPRRYPDPETFRLDRNAGDHLAFGSGIHYCLGAYLSKLEVHRVLEQLVHHVRRIELDGCPVWNRHPTIRALRHLPLRLLAA